MNKMCRTNTQSGRSMIEMLGVLAIIGVLSVGGIAGYSKAMSKFKINKSIDQISQIVNNIRTLYAGHTTYAGLNNKTAIKMGVIPDELGTDYTSGILTNTYNGNVYVGAVEYKTIIPGNKAFMVVYRGLPYDVCIALATHDWGGNETTGLIGIHAMAVSSYLTATVDGITSQPDSFKHNICRGSRYVNNVVACSGGDVLGLPMSVVAASDGCRNCRKNNSCTVAWKYF